jgi:hypothetical protein
VHVLAVVTVVGVISLIDLRLLGVQSHHVSIRRLMRELLPFAWGASRSRRGYRVAAFPVPSPRLLAETALPVRCDMDRDSSVWPMDRVRQRMAREAIELVLEDETARAICSQSSVSASSVARIYPFRSAWERKT